VSEQTSLPTPFIVNITCLSVYPFPFHPRYTFVEGLSTEAAKNMRRLAAQLQAQAYGIIGYGILQKLSVVPPRDDVIAAVRELIGLSNGFPGMSVGMGQGHINIDSAAAIERLLRLYGRKDTATQPGN